MSNNTHTALVMIIAATFFASALGGVIAYALHVYVNILTN